MKPISRRLLLSATALPAFGGIARAAAGPVRVGSKLDVEAAVLGTVVLLLLRAGGVPTESRLRLGPTSILRRAILSGEVDIYPEYTGNGAFFFNQESDPVWKNAGEGYERVRSLDEANQLVWLTPAPADNTWGIAVQSQVAAQNQLRTMEEFARWANEGGQVKLAASAEFAASPGALPSFEQTYGFRLASGKLLILAGGDTAATERAAAEGTSGVNAAMAYRTDGALAALALVLMEDTRHAQMVYEPCPVVRRPVLETYKQIPDLLAPAFAGLDGPTLRTLNAHAAVDGFPVATVARDWLKEKGLLQ